MSRCYIDDIRQRLGLEEGDASHDDRIEQMTAEQRLAHICGWHLGDPGWARTFLAWARDSGFEITETKPSS
jgi:hypothetical protein